MPSTSSTTASPVSSATSPTTSPSGTTPAPKYIGALKWVPGRHGNDLWVTPTTAGRTVLDGTAEDAAWREVIGREPSANTVSMQRQFVCHWRYARNKDTWNLEPWRAAVPLDQVIAAYCNPGGPE